MKDTIIKAENISKMYRLGVVGTGTLSHDLNRWWHTVRGKEDPYIKLGQENKRDAKGSEYVWALKDINFEVKQGEVVGVIGRNGAGKSTLLKVLSRVTKPTTGYIGARGRIASLLEVGTGFHPELTGRENIFLNGAILGMTRREIKAKFDEIVSFAGVERYIDTPVKRYSSGMYVRLAFGVAAHLEPEILIVDEVLAVGDAEFQKKAIGKMQDVSRNGGRTVLFVSHNMASLQNLCTRGILMENGKNTASGTIDEVIKKYLSHDSGFSEAGADILAKRTISDAIRIDSIYLTDDNGARVSSFKMGERININLEFAALEEIEGINFNFRLTNDFNTNIAAWRTSETISELKSVKQGPGKVTLTVKDLNVFEGTFFFSVAVLKRKETLFFADKVIQFEIVPAQVTNYNQIVSKNMNLIYTDCSWDLNF